VINNRGEFDNDTLAHQLIDHDERGVY
jgi:hypothetical protein